MALSRLERAGIVVAIVSSLVALVTTAYSSYYQLSDNIEKKNKLDDQIKIFSIIREEAEFSMEGDVKDVVALYSDEASISAQSAFDANKHFLTTTFTWYKTKKPTIECRYLQMPKLIKWVALSHILSPDSAGRMINISDDGNIASVQTIRIGTFINNSGENNPFQI